MASDQEFVQVGDKIFNRRHVVGLLNKGKTETYVVTRDRDFTVDVPLSMAAAALGMGDFAEVGQ